MNKTASKNYLIESAKQLFKQKGFSAVSVQAIFKKAGVSKMSFYRHFNNKADIASHIIKQQIDIELAWAESLLKEKISIFEKLQLLMLRRQQTHEKLGVQFVEECTHHRSKQLNTFWQKQLKRINKMNFAFFQLGKKQKAISPNINKALFLYFMQKRNELISDKTFIKLCPDVKTRFDSATQFFYYGIHNFKQLPFPKEKI